MKEKLIKLITDALNTLGISEDNISLEIPKNKDNGDYSTNIALKNAKKINKSPMELANSLKDLIHSEFIEEVNVAMPGFINFKLKKDYLYENLNNVLTLKGDYGRQSFGNNEKVNIEFVGFCTDICVVSNVLIAKAAFYDRAKIQVDASCCAGVTP